MSNAVADPRHKSQELAPCAKDVGKKICSRPVSLNAYVLVCKRMIESGNHPVMNACIAEYSCFASQSSVVSALTIDRCDRGP